MFYVDWGLEGQKEGKGYRKQTTYLGLINTIEGHVDLRLANLFFFSDRYNKQTILIGLKSYFDT